MISPILLLLLLATSTFLAVDSYRGAGDLLQFSLDSSINLKKKMDTDGQFKDFEEAFKDIKVSQADQHVI